MKGFITIISILLVVSLNCSSKEIYKLEDTLEIETYNLDKLRASIYLNECAYSLTRILKSESKIILLEEQSKLNNAYKWENVTNYPSVVEFRAQLQGQLNAMIINETNRERFKIEFEKKNNNAARDAMLGAISGVQVNVNPISLVSNVLLTSARAYMDYGKKKQENEDELDDKMWELEQNDMMSITALRGELFNVITETFGEYGISDNMFLRENGFEKLLNILANNDPLLKLAELNESMDTYQAFPPYWYELGCAYIDNLEKSSDSSYLNKAWEAFDKYEKMNSACPLFISDERIGMIALYKLKYGLPGIDIERLIQTVKNNIGKDASALLYAALLYDTRLNNPEKSLTMMRQCLNDPSLTGKNEFILAALTIWDKVQSKHVKELFVRAVANAEYVDLETYISFLYKLREDQSVNTYHLLSKMRKAFFVNIIDYDKDFGIKSISFIPNKDSGYLKFDDRDWKIVLEKRDHYTKEQFIYTSSIELADKDKFFSDIDDIYRIIKRKNKYFKHYPNEIEKLKLISQIKLNNEHFYYISSEQMWSDKIKMRLSYKSDDESKFNYAGNIENSYINFYNEYHVDKIDYCFNFNDPVDCKFQTKHNESQYTLRITLSNLEGNGEIVMIFATDYLSEDNTYFYPIGIEYYNEDFIAF